MIRTTNIRDGRINLEDCRHVTEATFDRWTRRAPVLEGDVILTREAPIGEVGYIQDMEGVFLGQRTVQYRANPNVMLPRFLFYAFLSPELQHQFRSHEGSGSVVSHIRVADCHKFIVPVPPRSEQAAISELLGALDDKIELNRRMNETLEAMARAIFKDWFVDFGPTRAKMEGRAPYLAPEIWALFPEKLDDEGKPEGWSGFQLAQLTEYHKQTITPVDHPTTYFEHFSLPAFDGGQNPVVEQGEKIRSNKTRVPQGAVLLSKLNPEISRVWLPEPMSGQQQVCSTEFLVFTPKSLANRTLLYSVFKADGFRARLQSMVTGTSKSHQRVSPHALLSQEVIAGSEAIFAAFGDAVGSLLLRVLACRAECRTLAGTRDLLLPKLMSGEIRVKDAEKLAEAAA